MAEQSSSELLPRPGGILGKRRNGLQPACESCRKAKVRCDITASDVVCSRCKKRKNIPPCIFLEAPMTRSKRDSPFRKSTSPIVKDPSEQTIQSPGAARSIFSGSTPVSSQSTITQNSGTPLSTQSILPQKSTESSGYLGLTSYNATLRNSGLHPPGEDVEVPIARDNPKAEPRDVKMGVHILKYLPDEETSQLFLQLYVKNSIGIMGLPNGWINRILSSIFTTFEPALKYPFVEKELENVATRIIENGQAPVVEPDDPSEYLASMSGENTRWDLIGVLFIAFAYTIRSTPDKGYPPVDERIAYRDRKVVVRELRECIDFCIQLSRKSLHPTVIILLYNNVALETALEGDSSLSVWRLHHDLAAVASAIGLHCYQGNTTLTLPSEMKKRLSGICFRIDKEVAMFTGRPPALSHRYYNCPLPLEIDDEILVEGGGKLQQELNNLDKDGWNKNGKICDATKCRFWVLSALIQDEIMELFLGNVAHFSMDRINALKTRTREVFANVPHLINVTKEKLINADFLTEVRSLFYNGLDYLRIHFLLERLSVERGHESKQKLVDVSREMVDLTVALWLQRDRTIIRHYDYDYIIMCYGMPSTGILCTELLHQIRYPKTSGIKFPTSEVVQNLSFMIGFLEWITPDAGNYKLCQHMARVIKRVLERVFDPAPVDEVQTNEQQLQGFEAEVWGVDGIDDFDWLNSIDWGRGPF